MNRPYRIAIAVAALAVAGLSAPVLAQEKSITIGLPGIPPVFVTTQAYVAEQQGFFKKHGLKVNLRPFDSGAAAARAMTVLLRKLAGFSGLLHENMYRFTGWRFLEIGRRLERGIQIARTLARLTDPEAPDGALDMMLEIGDSVMTHRRQYNVQSSRRTVLDLLALDPLNPRAVLFQLERLKVEINLLPGGTAAQMTPAAKEVLRLHTALAIRDPAEMTPEALHGLASEIAALYDGLAGVYFA